MTTIRAIDFFVLEINIRNYFLNVHVNVYLYFVQLYYNCLLTLKFYFLKMEKMLANLISKPAGYSVYVHWPYCLKICSYCNFNKYRLPLSKVDDNEKLRHSFIKQLSRLLHKSQFPIVTSVYFGGGTPSLAPPNTISSILNTIRREVGLAKGAEITLEVNPTEDVIDKMAVFKEVGVNRVSIGVQSLNDGLLEDILYRSHNASNARHVVCEASRLFGGGAVNVDVMFGLPGQTDGDTVNDVNELLQICPGIGHFSLYQLTLERGTEMFKYVKNKKWILPSENDVTHCYEELISELNKHKFVQYEISNFAREGFESAHNQNYWLGGNYIGIGPGAHSCYRDPLVASKWWKTVNCLTPAKWMKELEIDASGILSEKSVSDWERFEEVFCSCLRTNVGFTKQTCSLFGIEFKDIVNIFNSEVNRFVVDGYVTVNETSIKASRDKGRMVLDTILPYILVEFKKFK